LPNFVCDLFPEDSRALAMLERAASRILIPNGIYYQNKLAAAQHGLQDVLPCFDTERRLAFPSLVRKCMDYEWQNPTPFNFLARLILQLRWKYARTLAYAQSSLDMARVAIALERYRIAHGEYPKSLDVLAPQFIKELPHDIMNGQPLHYRLESDGRFTLYSVGWNQKDDGGKVAYKKTDSKNPSINGDEGDWVWSYPAEKEH
jgi:hypothetical protein